MSFGSLQEANGRKTDNTHNFSRAQEGMDKQKMMEPAGKQKASKKQNKTKIPDIQS